MIMIKWYHYPGHKHTLLTRHPVRSESVCLVGVGVDALEGVGDHEDDGTVLPGGLVVPPTVHHVLKVTALCETQGKQVILGAEISSLLGVLGPHTTSRLEWVLKLETMNLSCLPLLKAYWAIKNALKGLKRTCWCCLAVFLKFTDHKQQSHKVLVKYKDWMFWQWPCFDYYGY